MIMIVEDFLLTLSLSLKRFVTLSLSLWNVLAEIQL